MSNSATQPFGHWTMLRLSADSLACPPRNQRPVKTLKCEAI